MLTLTGIYKGYKRTGEGDRQKVLLGFAVPLKNGFKDQERITEVRLSKEKMAANVQDQFKDLMDKEVAVPVMLNTWAYNGRAYHEFFLVGDPVAVPAQLKKAS